ncbi:hypothetical protein CMO90_01225 [Candidatus Woesearchaeota archaeon]|jgi:hypothetical protein|nr:hypothetical protein [Candidatus Woesearchaeota archaeon]|tara:strand:- start:631 stop:1191 length:561 start_codon:yes stop_codon:yes gene_type:complete
MKKVFFKAYFLFILFIISFLISLFVYGGSFYIHEGGHIAYGFLGNLIEDGTITKFSIENWIDMPLFSFIKLPQRTKIIEGNPSLNFALGGIITIILMSTFLAILYYKKSKNKNKKYVFLLPIIFTIHEISGNFICGTDNITGNPLDLCNPFFGFLTKSIIWMLVGVFMLLFYYKFQEKFNKFFKIS